MAKTIITLAVFGAAYLLIGAGFWIGESCNRHKERKWLRDSLKDKEFWFEDKHYRAEQIGELKE